MNQATVLGCIEDDCGQPVYCKKRCRRHYMRKYGQSHKRSYSERNVRPATISAYQKKWRRTLLGRWKQFRSNSKNRGIDVSLSLNDFKELTSRPCAYCGGTSPEREYVGIDRVENSKGYSRDNVLPCCSICNAMKSKMTVSQWFDQMEKILAFSGKPTEKTA